MTSNIGIGLSVVAGAFCLLAAGGCGGPDSAFEHDQASPAAGQQTLTLGSRGPDVRRANAYLRTYGYFPNDSLAAQFPDWTPIVLQGPSEEDLLDEHTALALRKFQLNFGLPATGNLDPASLSRMSGSRCGVPDTDPEDAKRVAKWDIFDNNTGNHFWLGQGPTITYTFAQPTLGLGTISATLAQRAINTGLNRWSAVTGFTFVNVTGQGMPDLLSTDSPKMQGDSRS